MVSLVISYIDATEWIDEYTRSYRVDENIEQLSIEFKKFFTINEEGLIEKEKVPIAKEQLIVDEAGWTIEAIAHHQKMMDKIAMEVDIINKHHEQILTKQVDEQMSQ